jgi:hypothetical protein
LTVAKGLAIILTSSNKQEETIMTTINLTPAIKTALLQSVEQSIDIFNDMALESLYLNPTQIRELAVKPDADIRAEINKLQNDAWEQLEQLISLQILYSELKSE